MQEIDKGGRPPKWENVKQFIEESDGFFDWCVLNEYIPDVEGLAVYLKTSRKVIHEYEKKPQFSNTIKEIKDKISFYKKQKALKGEIPAAVFCFDFKNNHDYSDKQEIDHKNNGNSFDRPKIIFTKTEGKTHDDRQPDE